MVSASSLTGAAGEHFVMSELLRRGYIGALAPAGVPNCDIIVTDEIGARLCAIQVKTRNNTGKDRGWHMSSKHETLAAPTLFYAFVDFAAEKECPPFVYVVPAAIVAEALRVCYQAWLEQPGAKGQQRKANDMRRLLPCNAHLNATTYASGWLEPFRNNWDSLKKTAA